MPFIKYFYEVSNAVQDGIYIINHLNFSPADMLTHNGIFCDNQIDEKSYFFTQNEKHTINQYILPEGQSTNGCLIGVYFWMQNTLQHYERNYDKFQDLLSNIGGFSSIISTIGYYLNLLINYYITLVDIEELIIDRDEMNYIKHKNINKNPIFLRKINQIKNPPKKAYITSQKILSSKNKGKEGLGLNGPNDLKFEEIEIYNNSKMTFQSKYSKANNIGNEKNQIDNLENAKHSTKEIKYKENKEELPINKHNFNWFKYIWYLIGCKSNDIKISYFENIRSSLISEENIIQNYLDIYKLLKINDINNKDIFNNIKY